MAQVFLKNNLHRKIGETSNLGARIDEIDLVAYSMLINANERCTLQRKTYIKAWCRSNATDTRKYATNAADATSITQRQRSGRCVTSAVLHTLIEITFKSTFS